MNDWQSDTRRAILAANSGGESYRKMAARLGLPARRASWLCDIARGKSAPTRKLAHALGVVTERDGDRVRFGVWMTRAQRDRLQAAIDHSGMTRLEWLQAAAETQPLSSEVFAGWCVWRDGEMVTQ